MVVNFALYVRYLITSKKSELVQTSSRFIHCSSLVNYEISSYIASQKPQPTVSFEEEKKGEQRRTSRSALPLNVAREERAKLERCKLYSNTDRFHGLEGEKGLSSNNKAKIVKLS